MVSGGGPVGYDLVAYYEIHVKFRVVVTEAVHKWEGL